MDNVPDPVRPKLTVGKLREVIEDLPADLVIWLEADHEYASHAEAGYSEWGNGPVALVLE